MNLQKSQSILLLIFTMLVWGSSYAITKSVVNILPPASFTLLRFLIALICLGPFYLMGKKSARKTEKISRSDCRWLLLMGLTGITLYYILFNYALMYTSASNGALIQGFIPICIALFGVFFLKEKLTARQFSGIGLSFAGVVLVGFIAAEHTGEDTALLGNLLMIVSVFCWTIYTLISRKLQHLSPLSITVLSGLAGTIFLLPVSIYECIQLTNWPSVDLNGWLAILYLGAISSAFCYLMYNKALERLPAALVGNFLNLDILAGVLIAVLFLHEKTSVVQMVGGALILLGLVLSSRKTAP